jgi:lipopolysaccharide biosynthesis glycosyltransferase
MITSSASNIQQKLCLATVSNKEYWPGTRVMIKSFLLNNNWFKGDILIITADSYIEKKLRKFPFIKTVKPSTLIQKAIENLCIELPKYSDIKDRFYLFELFQLEQYDRVLYADSDVLFTQSLDENILLSPDLGAVPDPWHFRAYAREKYTCRKIPLPLTQTMECYKLFYNSGFLSFGKKFLGQKTYAELIEKINPSFFNRIDDQLADEPILNSIFEGAFTSLDISFNCPIHLLTEGVVKINPAVLHYTGKNKPWRLVSWIRLVFRRKKYLKLLFQWLWYRLIKAPTIASL